MEKWIHEKERSLGCYYLGQSSTGQQLIPTSYFLKVENVISQYSTFLISTQIYTQEKNTITLALSSSSALNTHTDIIPQP
jgi:hypothetical protein